MALSGSFEKYPVSGFGLYCTWSATQSVTGNYSDVTLNVYLKYYTRLVRVPIPRFPSTTPPKPILHPPLTITPPAPKRSCSKPRPFVWRITLTVRNRV